MKNKINNPFELLVSYITEKKECTIIVCTTVCKDGKPHTSTIKMDDFDPINLILSIDEKSKIIKNVTHNTNIHILIYIESSTPIQIRINAKVKSHSNSYIKLEASSLEFWFESKIRLHKRYFYSAENDWKMNMLYP